MPVYFAAPGDADPPTKVKIGWTDGPVQERLDGLQTANHEVLRVIRVVDGDPDLERWFHKRFAAQRLYRRREWFSFHPDMLTVALTPRQRPEPAPMSVEDAEINAKLEELIRVWPELRRQRAELVARRDRAMTASGAWPS